MLSNWNFIYLYEMSKSSPTLTCEQCLFNSIKAQRLSGHAHTNIMHQKKWNSTFPPILALNLHQATIGLFSVIPSSSVWKKRCFVVMWTTFYSRYFLTYKTWTYRTWMGQHGTWWAPPWSSWPCLSWPPEPLWRTLRKHPDSVTLAAFLFH